MGKNKNKLQRLIRVIFIGENYSKEDESQNYLIFQPVFSDSQLYCW